MCPENTLVGLEFRKPSPGRQMEGDFGSREVRGEPGGKGEENSVQDVRGDASGLWHFFAVGRGGEVHACVARRWAGRVTAIGP